MSSYSEPLTIEDAQRVRRSIDRDFEQARLDRDRRLAELKKICSHKLADGRAADTFDPVTFDRWCVGCETEL